ncbi:LIM domain-containing protein [Methanosarcina sp.]|uniref:LIM domain-containing protein n=1 Tax=Methanosarcina sp. TaxID=2213 RepID=UPI003BB5FE66
MTEGKTSLFKCNICGCEMGKEECIEEEGKLFCEDCYIEGHHKIQACNPWAVRSKKIFREEAGLEGTEGLTELQKAIYEFIVSSGGAKKEEIAKKLEISLLEAENQFALLRHCELVKGQKRADGVYLVPFES